MDEVVDQVALAVAVVVADEVGAAELVVAVDEGDGLAELGGQVEGQRGLAGARPDRPG